MKKENNEDVLKLKNQLCFPMYLVSKEVIKTYSIFLDPLGITYTQYLVMMVMWEYHEIEMKELEKKLYLDSNTLSDVINRLSKKLYISKEKAEYDKRVVILKLEKVGYEMAKKAKEIPLKLYDIVGLSVEETETLSKIIQKILEKLLAFQEQIHE